MFKLRRGAPAFKSVLCRTQLKVMPGLPHVNAKEPPALLPNSAPTAGTLELMRRLAPNEVLIASLALDLDDNLHYASGVLAITATRLLVQNPRDQRWSEYAINSSLTLDYGDHAGVATLELRDADCTLSRWHFTLQQHRAGRRLIEDFQPGPRWAHTRPEP